MKSTVVFCIALSCAASVASSALAETSPRVKRHAGHHAIGVAAPTLAQQATPNDATAPSWLTRLFPNVKPYPPGQGDADGLSRNIEDCNKGCIGVPIR